MIISEGATMFVVFWMNNTLENNVLNGQLEKLEFHITNTFGNNTENACNVEDSFYSSARKMLSSDAVVIDQEKGLSFNDGALLMMAKLYKIPIYSYHTSSKTLQENEMFQNIVITKSFEGVEELIHYFNEVHQNRKMQIIHDRVDPEDVLLRLGAFDAGYDSGYFETQSFWGNRPANFVQIAADRCKKLHDVKCIDLGCGTGKNACYLDQQGFSVQAIDSSYYAILQAKSLKSNVTWKTRDVRKWVTNDETFDIVVMTGLLHCYSTAEEIEETVKKAKRGTKPGGYNVVSVFNDREQDLSGHPVDFVPILLPHEFYMNLYKDWTIIASSDTILYDRHPNNNIAHKHSITRILAQKVSGEQSMGHSSDKSEH